MTSPQPIKCWATTNSVMIDPQGYIRPCCKYDKHFGHIDEFDSIEDILNSDQYKLLRKRHSYGNITKACWRCKESEDRGYISRRQSYEYDKRFTENHFELDISPGLYCNLKCRMCGPYNSTSWIPDYKKLVEQGIVSKYGADVNVYNMPEYDVDKIVSFISNTDYKISVELKGGEPLMTPATKSLFERLGEYGDRISLNMITNGTYTPSWLPASLKNFKKVLIGISADGVGDMYNYIRGDNKKYTWEKFKKSINWFNEMSTANFLNVEIFYNFTVQNTNVHQIPKFAEAVGTQRINWLIVNNPSFLTTKVMPAAAKKYALSQIKPWMEKLNDPYKYGHIKAIVDELASNNKMDKDLYKQYIKYNAGLDKLRNQNLFDVAPQMITKFGKKIYDSV